MSTEPRGRHRAARHAAPKKKFVSGKHLGALMSVAGMSSVVATSGSTVAGVTQSGDISVLDTTAANVLALGPAEPVVTVENSTSRAQAATYQALRGNIFLLPGPSPDRSRARPLRASFHKS